VSVDELLDVFERSEKPMPIEILEQVVKKTMSNDSIPAPTGCEFQRGKVFGKSRLGLHRVRHTEAFQIAAAAANGA